jgi:hypothetical protein
VSPYILQVNYSAQRHTGRNCSLKYLQA